MKKKTKKITKPNKLAYEGKVKVTIFHGGSAYKTMEKKNEGGMPLFRYFAHCLCGDQSPDDRPFYLRLYSVDPMDVDNVSSWTEITTTAIPLRGNPTLNVDQESNSMVTLEEFLIPAAALGDDPANLIVLYSRANRNVRDKWSARVLLESGDAITKDSGTTNVVVEWSLIIGNK